MDINEVFTTIDKDREQEFDFSFSSDKELNNLEALSQFAEENDLSDYVAEDMGTTLLIKHDDYDFEVAVISEGLGDFFTHGIYVGIAGI